MTSRNVSRTYFDTYPKSIFLVRHGESAANAARIVQMPEAPLSERGIEQAQRLATRLARRGVEAIVSSDYTRARLTAERIRDATGANVDLWPDLRERNFGLLRGRPYAELQVDIFAPDYAPPGGETWDEFHARVARVWKEITAVAAKMRGNLVVVSHGLVCRSVVERLVGLGDHAAPPHWPNASLTVITADPPATVVGLNLVEHLADLVGSIAPEGGAV